MARMAMATPTSAPPTTSAISPGTLESILATRGRLLRMLTRALGNADEAEEVLQQAFEKALARVDTLRAQESAVAWFTRLVRNATVDHLRRVAVRERAHRRWVTESESRAIDMVDDAVCRCVTEMLSGLRQAYAHVLRRVDLENASIQDVARGLGTTPNNVRVRLHRARAALRARLLSLCVGCRDRGHLDCGCR
jgi:RNA polymerase sigma factor (sigma-70 family)